MSQTFALKSALRKSMLRQLKTLPDELVEQQCERIVHVAVKVAAAVRCLGWGCAADKPQRRPSRTSCLRLRSSAERGPSLVISAWRMASSARTASSRKCSGEVSRLHGIPRYLHLTDIVSRNRNTIVHTLPTPSLQFQFHFQFHPFPLGRRSANSDSRAPRPSRDEDAPPLLARGHAEMSVGQMGYPRSGGVQARRARGAARAERGWWVGSVAIAASCSVDIKSV
jgi:hypothetical protein